MKISYRHFVKWTCCSIVLTVNVYPAFYLISLYLTPHRLNHPYNFLVFLQLALAASNNAYHCAHNYLNWKDEPIAYWEVLKEKDRNGDCECNTEERGNVTKLLPEGIA